MSNTFKTVLVACAAIAVSWLSAGTVQTGLEAQLADRVRAVLNAQKAAEDAVLTSHKSMADSLAGEAPFGAVTK